MSIKCPTALLADVLLHVCIRITIFDQVRHTVAHPADINSSGFNHVDFVTMFLCLAKTQS